MARFLKRIRFIFNVKKFIPFLFEYFFSANVSTKNKIISLLLVFGYAIFPFDVVPDFLAFFGILDDFAIVTLILQQIIKMAPEELKRKYELFN